MVRGVGLRKGVNVRIEQHNMFGGIDVTETSPLRDRYGEPPLTVLRANTPEWFGKKRAWHEYGIGRDDGREGIDKCMDGVDMRDKNGYVITRTDVSVFDPYLCQILIGWFSGLGDTIYDPFAGGSVRGLISGYYGRRYVGIDVRAEQVAVNIKAAENFAFPNGGIVPKWIHGDSTIGDMEDTLTDIPEDFNLMLSCPPYGNLEVYSNQEDDISNMGYNRFLERYRSAIRLAYWSAKKGAFAVFVVGEFRDKKTNHLIGFVPDTIRAFTDAGWNYYNEAIYIQPLGSAPQRAERVFLLGNKKLTKTHSNILVFIK